MTQIEDLEQEIKALRLELDDVRSELEPTHDLDEMQAQIDFLVDYLIKEQIGFKAQWNIFQKKQAEKEAEFLKHFRLD